MGPWFLIKIGLLVTMAVGSVYVHHRGRVRFSFSRQLFDHSTFFSPINLPLYYFSCLAVKPFIDRAHFPELDDIQSNWAAIRDEAVALMHANKICAADGDNDAGFNSFFKTGWQRFYLKWYGSAIPSALEHCPKTTALLGRLPCIRAAMFASLPPGAKLVKHRDPFAGSLRYHLGLLTPNSDDCYLLVDGEHYSWRDGEDVIFDETFIHCAENTTDKPRIILFCDIERPMRTAAARYYNRFVGYLLMRGSQTRNLTGDKVGWINHVFSCIYPFRRWGKSLKKSNKLLYQLSKALCFGTIALLFFYW